MDKYISKARLYGAIEELISQAREDYLEKFKISSDADAFDLMECQTRMYERTAFKFLIADFPTADVKPTVYGLWRWHENDNEYECSACESLFDYDRACLLYSHDDYPRYCPNCGAKMIGGV